MSTKLEQMEKKFSLELENVLKTLKDKYIQTLPPLKPDESEAIKKLAKEIRAKETEFENKLTSDKTLYEILILSKQLEILDSFEIAKNKELVIFLGQTEVGKSTNNNFLRGVNYKVTRGGISKAEIFDKPEKLELAETGRSLESVTLYPKPYPINFLDSVLYLTDFPGFNGVKVRDSHRVFESLSSQIVINNAAAIKAVVLVTEPNTYTRGGQFQTYLENLSNFLEDNAIAALPFIIIVNKVSFEAGQEDEIYKDIFEQISFGEKLIKDKRELKVSERDTLVKAMDTQRSKGNFLMRPFAGTLERFMGPTAEVQKIRSELKKISSEIDALSKQLKLLEKFNKEDNIILLDIEKQQIRNKILIKIAAQKAVKEVRKIFNFSSYDEKRKAYNLKFTDQVEYSREIIKSYLTAKSLMLDKKKERNLVLKELEISKRRLQGIGKDDPTEKAAKIEDLRLVIHSIDRQIKLQDEMLIKLTGEHEGLSNEKNNIVSAKDHVIRKLFTEKRMTFFGKISWSAHEISYGEEPDEVEKPFYKITENSEEIKKLFEERNIKNGKLIPYDERITKGQELGEDVFLEYQAIYKSGWGEDGFCELTFHIKNKHIRSNARRIKQIDAASQRILPEITKLKENLSILRQKRIEHKKELEDTIQNKKKTEEIIAKQTKELEKEIEKSSTKIKVLEAEINTQEINYYSAIKILRENGHFFEALENLIQRLKLETATEMEFIKLYTAWKESLNSLQSDKKHITESSAKKTPSYSFEELLQLAEKDSEAQCKLGLCYAEGNGVQQNFEKAFLCFKQAHERGNRNASFHLALCYIRGQGVGRDTKMAVPLLNTVINSEIPIPRAFHQLAICYHIGQGIKRDVQKAKTYEFRAFELFNHPDYDEDATLLFFRGNCFEIGFGTQRNEQQAFLCYQKAANLNNPLALFYLAECYEKAISVPRQEKFARETYQRAYSLLKCCNKENDPLILYHLGICAEKLYPYKPELAFNFFKKASEWHHTAAQLKLAVYYYTGKGIHKNEKQAYELFASSLNATKVSLSEILELDTKNFLELEKYFVRRELSLKNETIDLATAKKIAHFLVLDQNVICIDMENAILAPGALKVIAQALKINGSVIKCDTKVIKGLDKLQNARELQEIRDSLAANASGLKFKLPWKKILDTDLLRTLLYDNLSFDFSQSKDIEQFINAHLGAAQQTRFFRSNPPLNPVHLAAILGHPALINKFFECHLPISSEDCLGNTALDYAAMLGHIEVVAALLDLGAVERGTKLQISRTLFRALEFAIIGHHWQVVKILLLHPEANAALRNKDGDTLFHCAARSNSARALGVLIGNPKVFGLNLAALNNQGFSPLHLAALYGCLDIIKYLAPLDLNFELKTRSSDQFKEPLTALELAVMHCQQAAVTLLLAQNASITEKAKGLAEQVDLTIFNALKNAEIKRSALHRAMPQRNVDLSRILSLVFKGGGVKGLGHIGALLQIYHDDPTFFARILRTAGTSAGAINAFLLAIGYNPDEMQKIAMSLDFITFLDGKEQKMITELSDMISAGVSWDTALTKIAEPLKFAFKQGKKSVDKILTAKSKYNKGYYGSAVGNILKSSAHAYVAYDEVVEQAEFISKLFSDIKDIYKKIKEDFGIFPGETIVSEFCKWINDRARDTKLGFDETLTFGELHELHKKDPTIFKDLYIVVTNLSKSRPEVFSYESTPEVLIIDAVRASMAIPFFFKPVKIRCKKEKIGICIYSEDTYVDGGILLNYPIKIFDRRRYMQAEDLTGINEELQLLLDEQEIYNDTTLGFCLINGEEGNFLSARKLNPIAGKKIDGIIEYLSKLIFLYANSEDIMHVTSSDDKRTVYINSLGISTVDFALKREKQDTLLYAGRVGMIDAYNKIPGAKYPARINQNLLAALIKHADFRYFSSTPSGINLENIKLAITTPETLSDILKEIQNEGEIQFITQLPIDFNVTDSENRTILHRAILQHTLSLSADKAADKLIAENLIKWLLKLGQDYIDFEACDCNNKSVLDYLKDQDDKDLYLKVSAYIPGKHPSFEELEVQKKEMSQRIKKLSREIPAQGDSQTGLVLAFSRSSASLSEIPVSPISISPTPSPVSGTTTAMTQGDMPDAASPESETIDGDASSASKGGRKFQ